MTRRGRDMQQPVHAAVDQDTTSSGAAGLPADDWAWEVARTAMEEAARARAELDEVLAARADLRLEQGADPRHVKSAFLATMSHELRTPLNAIAGYAELLSMGLCGPLTKEQGEAVERIKRGQQHLLALVNGVLDFARCEANQLPFDVRDVPLRETLATVHATLAPRFQLNAQRYEFLGCPDEVHVHCDRQRLQQIIINVLENAARFTASGGRITLGAEMEGERVQVFVRDDGRGIPAGKLDEIFEPFIQVEDGLTRPYEGAGMGLAVSRSLARHMGGDLTVKSEMGHGSVFTLTLPRAVSGSIALHT
ncbi:MAG: sensor protein [Gemmatimonadetes bacterium]|nr:sensor protein [Gemmatimonadota bacterium]